MSCCSSSYFNNINSQKNTIISETNPATLKAIFTDKYQNVTLMTDDYRTLYCLNPNPPTEFNQTGMQGPQGNVNIYDPSTSKLPLVNLSPYAETGPTGSPESVTLTTSTFQGPRGPSVRGVSINPGFGVTVNYSNGNNTSVSLTYHIIEVDTPPTGTFPVYTTYN